MFYILPPHIVVLHARVACASGLLLQLQVLLLQVHQGRTRPGGPGDVHPGLVVVAGGLRAPQALRLRASNLAPHTPVPAPRPPPVHEHALRLLDDVPQGLADVRAKVLPLKVRGRRGLLQEPGVAQGQQVRALDQEPLGHGVHPSWERVVLLPGAVHLAEVRETLVGEPEVREPLLQPRAALLPPPARDLLSCGLFPRAHRAQGVRQPGEGVEGQGPRQGLPRPPAGVQAVHAAQPEVELPRGARHVPQQAGRRPVAHQGLLHHPAHDVRVVRAVPPPHVLPH
mmetsp:Transcript_22367/g.47009  ORF Transcript_22367/g.47009 Transcript_22367/m.47009 type:complete len:283 (+) Transcript_22367:26-874(+)